MTWFDTFADDEQQSVEQLQKQGITGKPTNKKEVGLFDGAVSAPFRGVAAGAIKAVDTVSYPFARAKDHIAYSLNDDDDFSKPLDVRKEQSNQYYTIS